MFHEPAAQPQGKDHALAPKARLGIKLFAVYSVIYSGFVVLSVLAPRLLEMELFFGLNLAVAYGFGLIILAILLGLAYNRVCPAMEDRVAAEQKD